MNLELIDRAIASYPSLDSMDHIRLMFFRKLWAALDDCSQDLQQTWEVPDATEANERYAANRTLLPLSKFELDRPLFLRCVKELNRISAAEGPFSEGTREQLAKVDWDAALAEVGEFNVAADPFGFLNQLGEEIYWQPGMDEETVYIDIANAQMALRVQLEPVAKALSDLIVPNTEKAMSHRCPVCHDQAALAIDFAGIRLLGCMRCGTEWQYVTNRCPRCGNSDPEKMRHVHLDEDMKHSVLLCSNCNDYVRIVSTDDPAEVSLEVEDVVMSWMDQIIRDPNFSAG